MVIYISMKVISRQPYNWRTYYSHRPKLWPQRNGGSLDRLCGIWGHKPWAGSKGEEMPRKLYKMDQKVNRLQRYVKAT